MSGIAVLDSTDPTHWIITNDDVRTAPLPDGHTRTATKDLSGPHSAIITRTESNDPLGIIYEVVAHTTKPPAPARSAYSMTYTNDLAKNMEQINKMKAHFLLDDIQLDMDEIKEFIQAPVGGFHPEPPASPIRTDYSNRNVCYATPETIEVIHPLTGPYNASITLVVFKQTPPITLIYRISGTKLGAAEPTKASNALTTDLARNLAELREVEQKFLSEDIHLDMDEIKEFIQQPVREECEDEICESCQ